MKSIFIAGHSGPACDGALRDDRSLSREGHDIYFRRRTRPRPISRKCHFRDPTFPESNNTESSFNKGSATIYRGYAPHPYQSDPSVHCHRVLSSILPSSLSLSLSLSLSRPFLGATLFHGEHKHTHHHPICRCPNFSFFCPMIPLCTLRAPDCSLSLSLPLSLFAIFYPRLVSLFLTMVILLRNSFQFIRNT